MRRGRARSPRCAPAPASWCGWPSKRGVAMVMVGHVTKDGQIAGPRVVEHMVDARASPSRASAAIRSASCAAVKNRFGATDEIGVFEMGDAGLGRGHATPRPCSSTASGQRAAGAAVFAGIEGSRPVLVEFQALVAPSAYGTPRRAVVGWDSGPPGHGAWRCWRRAAALDFPAATSI